MTVIHLKQVLRSKDNQACYRQMNLKWITLILYILVGIVWVYAADSCGQHHVPSEYECYTFHDAGCWWEEARQVCCCVENAMRISIDFGVIVGPAIAAAIFL